MNVADNKPASELLDAHIASAFSSPEAGEVVARFRGWRYGTDVQRAEQLRRVWPEMHAALTALSAREMFAGVRADGFEVFIDWVQGEEAPE